MSIATPTVTTRGGSFTCRMTCGWMWMWTEHQSTNNPHIWRALEVTVDKIRSSPASIIAQTYEKCPAVDGNQSERSDESGDRIYANTRSRCQQPSANNSAYLINCIRFTSLVRKFQIISISPHCLRVLPRPLRQSSTRKQHTHTHTHTHKPFNFQKR